MQGFPSLAFEVSDRVRSNLHSCTFEDTSMEHKTVIVGTCNSIPPLSRNSEAGAQHSLPCRSTDWKERGQLHELSKLIPSPVCCQSLAP